MCREAATVDPWNARVLTTLQAPCDGGDGKACALLAPAIEARGKSGDASKAAQLLIDRCKQDDVDCCTALLSRSYCEDGASSDGTCPEPLVTFWKRVSAPGQEGRRAMATRLCNAGSAKACSVAGHHFVDADLSNGKVPAAAEAGLLMFTKACDGGDAQGCAAGANLAERVEGDAGSRRQPFIDKELQISERLCDEGSYYHCAQLAVSAKKAKDLEKRRAALMGACAETTLDFTCEDLARMMMNGEGGPKDTARAFAIEERLCQSGETQQFQVMACSFAAQRYQTGDGVERDVAHACALWEKGCHFTGMVDDPLACMQIGRCYQRGEGVAKNLSKAADYFLKGCNQQGNPEACEARSLMPRGN